VIQRFVYALSAWISQLPRPLALNLASGLAGGLYFVYSCSPWRQLVAQPIQLAWPQWSARQVKALTRNHFRLLLWSLVDFLRFWRLHHSSGDAELQVRHWQHYQQAQAQGQGVILVSAHFGCWELIPAALSLQGQAVSVLVQKPSQAAVDRLFCDLRAAAGVRTLYNDSLLGLRPVLRALKQGETVGLVIDQHGESERLIGSFFGQTVSLPEGPAFLARHTQARIVPVLVRWQGQQHLLEFFPALQASDFASNLELMQHLYNWLESEIRQAPENWLWSYHRWNKYPSCPKP